MKKNTRDNSILKGSHPAFFLSLYLKKREKGENVIGTPRYKGLCGEATSHNGGSQPHRKTI